MQLLDFFVAAAFDRAQFVASTFARHHCGTIDSRCMAPDAKVFLV